MVVWNAQPERHAQETTMLSEIIPHVRQPGVTPTRRLQTVSVWNYSPGNATWKASECGTNQKFVDHACVECLAGKTSTGNHAALGHNTTREATRCDTNEEVADHVCAE